MTFDVSDEQVRRHAWVAQEEGFCFTFVQGMTVQQVLDRFPPSHPRQVDYSGLAEIGWEAYEHSSGTAYCAGGVTALPQDGWVLIVEIDGYGGTIPKNREALAAGGYAMALHTTVNCVDNLYGTSGAAVECRFDNSDNRWPGGEQYVLLDHFGVDAPTPALGVADVPAAVQAVGLIGGPGADPGAPAVRDARSMVRCMVFAELAIGVTVTEQDVRGATFDVIRIPE